MFRQTAKSLMAAMGIGWLLAGCVTASPAPAQRASPTPYIIATRWAALIEGELVEQAGCLRICGPSREMCRTLAWPPEFEFTRQGDELRVVGGFGRGETWRFRLGETVSFGGGEVRGLLGADEYTTFRVPADCPGPYWMFGGN